MGIFAHVDAGKTTLAEAMLFKAGALRNPGKVDNGSTVMDSHHLEKERGITIFTSGAVFDTERNHISLLDTPGHVDFSSETERTMAVLDYAIVVISGIDGVQSHTKTIWKLLDRYNVPAFIFVTKMDFARKSECDLIADLNDNLSPSCVNMAGGDADEHVALCDEELLEKYLGSGKISPEDISGLILRRKLFPCYFGSGLKGDGVDTFLQALDSYIVPVNHRTEFGAKCFKVSCDEKGSVLTHIKITGGSLKVRDTVEHGEKKEKAAQIRVYSGLKFSSREEVFPGEICAVTGLTDVVPGSGLGFEKNAPDMFSEPVMKYNIILPDGCDQKEYLPKLAQLSREDPLLSIGADASTGQICVSLMGEVQTEILKSVIYDRFGIDVEIEHGRVLYRETVKNRVEGVGHYEPLRHYAEVHLIIEPLKRGSGIVLASNVSEDSLDRNWQRLILTHLAEKEHRGVLTGSPLTDVKITLAAGRAHVKHTEGGDFRQATYRAVRQGLMQAENELLEPYYNFTLEVPCANTGRAITDIKLMNGKIGEPVISGNTAVLTGTAPVTEINGYARDVAAYTGGYGRLYLESTVYDSCHNSAKVIEEYGYNPEADLENTPDSVFCAHGGGFAVKWNKVPEYMHIESCLKSAVSPPPLRKRNFHIDDKELQAIMEKEFGKVEYRLYRSSPVSEKAEECTGSAADERRQYIIVDGYNVIFGWDILKEQAAADLGAARETLIRILSNYAAFTKNEVILVFDAYKVPGNPGEKTQVENIRVVYTKEQQLGDIYIEKLISEIGKNERVRVVTSDGMIQLSAVRKGVLRTSAREFESEIIQTGERINALLEEIRNKAPKPKLGENID